LIIEQPPSKDDDDLSFEPAKASSD